MHSQWMDQSFRIHIFALTFNLILEFDSANSYRSSLISFGYI